MKFSSQRGIFILLLLLSSLLPLALILMCVYVCVLIRCICDINVTDLHVLIFIESGKYPKQKKKHGLKIKKSLRKIQSGRLSYNAEDWVRSQVGCSFFFSPVIISKLFR